MVSHRTGTLAAIGGESLYGLSYVFTRGALGTASPLSLLALRFDVALVVLALLAATRVIRLHLPRHALPTLALLALLDPIAYYIGETLGVQRTSAAVSGLVLSAIPVASIIASALLLGSRPSRRQVVGVAITLAGVAATVLATGTPHGAAATGYLMLLVAVVAFALYTVGAERAAHTSDTDKTFAMIAGGALFFTLAALFVDGPSSLASTATAPAVAWRVVGLALGCTVGAYFLQNVSITAIGSASYATFVGISTVVSLVAAAVMLGEHILALHLVGGAAIVVGVYVANRRGGTDTDLH